MAERNSSRAMPYWLAEFEQLVTNAAIAAGLSYPDRSEAAFDGEDLVWDWRDYLGDDAVAADVRLRVSVDDSAQRIHTEVIGLAWPVAPRLRGLARSATRSFEDIDFALFLPDRRSLPGELERRLIDRLVEARTAARAVADELVPTVRSHTAAASLADRTASPQFSVVPTRSERLKQEIDELAAQMNALEALRKLAEAEPEIPRGESVVAHGTPPRGPVVKPPHRSADVRRAKSAMQAALTECRPKGDTIGGTGTTSDPNWTD